MLRRFLWEEDGQGLAEYGMLLMLMGIACLAAASFIGDEAERLAGVANSTLASISS